MHNIIRLFVKYGSHITFLLLQAICFYIIVNYNQDQKSIFINSSKIYQSKLLSKVGQLNTYLSLDEVNDSLATQNAKLIELYINRKIDDPSYRDSTKLIYNLTAARVVNSTYQLRNNHITVNKGSLHGIENDMGVIAPQGLVGIVRNTSNNYSHVISLLNTQIKISATLSSLAYPGTLVWKGGAPKEVSLEAIPKHINIAVGDSVITSGYSTIFPRGILIGKVKEFAVKKGSNSYDITVELINDIPNEKVVYIIENRLAEEQLTLEAGE